MKLHCPTASSSLKAMWFLTLTLFGCRREVELSKLQASVDALSATINDANNENTRSVSSARNAVRVRHTTEDVARLSASGAKAPQRAARGRPPERYEAAFAADATDLRWDGAAKRVMVERLNTAMPAGSTLRSIECHTTICRIETGHPDFDHFKGYFAAAFLDPATRVAMGNGGYSTPVDDDKHDDPVVIVSFMPREGKTLSARDDGPAQGPSDRIAP